MAVTCSPLIVSDNIICGSIEYVEKVTDGLIVATNGETVILQDYNTMCSTPPSSAESTLNRRCNLLNPNNNTYPTTFAVASALSGFSAGYTFTQSGITVITQSGNNINIYVPENLITGATNGLIITGSSISIGGTLINDTTINLASHSLDLNNGNLKLGNSGNTANYRLDVFGTNSQDAIRSSIGFDINPVSEPIALSGTAVTGSGLGIGTYFYRISYVTSLGETRTIVSSAIITTAGNQSINLTLPISDDSRVIGRKLYRTKVNSSETIYADYYLATINDNSTTTYTDNLPDSSLTAVLYSWARLNTTSNYITCNGERVAYMDSDSTVFGAYAGQQMANSYNGRDTLFGACAGQSMVCSFGNAFFGGGAGSHTTCAEANVGLGGYALHNNLTGSYNTAVGNAALHESKCNGNTAIGDVTMWHSSSGNYNVAVGMAAAYYNVSGNLNSIVGTMALYLSTGGSNNTINGTYGLYYAEGSNNLADGYEAGDYICDGGTPLTSINNSVLLGACTMALTNADTNEIVIGYRAIGKGSNSVTLGNDNIINTYLKGVVNSNCSFNTYNDYKISGCTIIKIPNNISCANLAIGINTLICNTTGRYNIGTGNNALQNNICGSSNTAVGYSSLQNNTCGGTNTAIGYFAMLNNTVGASNTSIGYAALQNNVNGSFNTANGYYALLNITSGSYNVGVGYFAGRYTCNGSSSNQTSNCSVYLGSCTMALANGDSNEIVIGYCAIGSGSNSVTLGNNAIIKTILNGCVGIGTSAPTYKLDVYGTSVLDGINTNVGLNLKQVSAALAVPTVTILSGGSVDIGSHYYNVVFYTAIGDTSRGTTVQAITSSGNQTVLLTNIPTSTDPSVIGRKIYRSKYEDNFLNKFL